MKIHMEIKNSTEKINWISKSNFFFTLKKAVHNECCHQCWFATVSVAVQQNTAYVIMQIYLFIVCNHATEPNMAFFVQKSRKGGGREGKKNWPLLLSCRAGGDAAENVTRCSVIAAGLGLEAASSLSPPQDYRGEWWALIMVMCFHCYTRKTHKQKAVRSGKQ